MSGPSADLGDVAQQMQDAAQRHGDRMLFTVGELLERIHATAGIDPTVTALGCQVAFAWLVDTEAV